MPTVQDFYETIDHFAPFALAESWDNVGILLGSGETPVRGALIALDVTGEVIDEAVRMGANLIISHHPVIFKALGRIPADSLVWRLTGERIHVVSAHTNLDIAEGGVNDVLARRLGLAELRGLSATASEPFCKVAVMAPPQDADAIYDAMAKKGAGCLGSYSHCGFMAGVEGRFKPLEGARPHIGAVGALERVEEVRLEMLVSPDCLEEVLAAMRATHPYEEPAYDVYHNHACTRTAYLGRIGRLSAPVSPEELARLVKERLGVGGVKYVAGSGPVDTVAVCGGSGADLIHTAKAMGAQALVTGESKHNLLLDARRMGMTLIDAEHFSTEAVVLESLCERIKERIGGVPVLLSASEKSEIRYL